MTENDEITESEREEPIDLHTQDSAVSIRPRFPRAVIALVGLGIPLGLSGCVPEPSAAVGYEIEAVSGAADGAELRFEYLTRETGFSTQQTTEDAQPLEAGSVRTGTIGRPGDEVSVSAPGLPGVVLRCEVTVEQVVLDEQESPAPGDGVSCSATVPEWPE